MLKSLFIKNYVLIKQLDLDFSQGFHAFTGETGAGKSIIVGAMSLILGNRADYSVIRSGEQKCEISVLFDINNNSSAQKWLHDQELYENTELAIRRIITVDGRSKSWINARPCTNASLKQLGELLVQIHGQHDQIKLNNAKYQLAVIDETGDYSDLLLQIATLDEQYKNTQKQLKEIESAGALNESESQLLRYQFEELSHLNLKEKELDQLHQQQKSLTGAVDTLNYLEKSLGQLTGDHNNVTNSIAEITQSLNQINSVDLTDVLSMLDEVAINLNEIEAEIQTQFSQVEINPEKLQEIENRLDYIYSTARKHQVNAENLFQHHIEMTEKLMLNDAQKQKREKLLANLDEISGQYAKKSLKLSNKRQQTAKIFSKEVTGIIQQLGLNKAQFIAQINHNPEANIAKNGQDACDFEVIMNPGQAAQKMSKTASGGELSRIALAIEICKKQDQSASFVFDEVDAGIGGAVAETVGKLMRKLSKNQQVFAVTHLPHVAGLAHHHYLVSKKEVNSLTQSAVELLDNNQRIDELARMSGGSVITDVTLKQAKTYLSE